MDKVKMFCSKDCPDTCSFFAYLDSKNNIQIEADKDGLLEKPFVCKKLKDFYKMEILNNNSQSFYIKDGKRIFDDVLQKLAQFLKKNHNKKILFYRGSGSLGYYMGFWDKVFSNFDNCYLTQGSPCDETGIEAHIEDFGVCTNPKIENLQLVNNIIMFGKDAHTTSQHLFAYLLKLKKIGKKIVYIDPIYSETAKIADRYIRINPATDGLLAYEILSSMNIVKTIDGLLNKIGITNDEFTYLKETIKPGKTAIIQGAGAQRYQNSKNAFQWINRLAYYTNNPQNLYFSRSSKEGLKKIKMDTKKSIKIADIKDKLRDNFFDIIVIVAANPLITMPNNKIWLHALKKARTIVVNTNENYTSKYADFFIKVDGMFSQYDIQGSYFFNKIHKRGALIKSDNSDIAVIKKLSQLLDINLEIPQLENIVAAETKNRRIFNDKTIDLKFPCVKKNKIRLITLSNINYLNSQTALVEQDTIYISKEIAEKYDINSGDYVKVKSSTGECIVRCLISSKTKGEIAFAYKNKSLCFNSLLEYKSTDTPFALSYYDLFIEIER
jgi:anaerobic selenocysteine-containing dehydrogenase